MFSFRRSALRVLNRPASTVKSLQASRFFATRVTAAPSSSIPRPSIPLSRAFVSIQQSGRSGSVPHLARRTYATNDPDAKDPEAVAEQAAETAQSETVVFAEDAAQVTENADVAAAAAAAPGTNPQRAQRNRSEPDPKVLYTGNLFFDISEATLQHEFEKIGPVDKVSIIRDARGLSKGFGYVTFQKKEDAQLAMEQLHNTVLAGRHMIVQPSRGNRSAPPPRAHPDAMEGFLNPPGKTLFIGNMSFEMTDKDLNDLFRKIKNVLDVRVAIDRRTGQPRGFAHADFTDTESALEAADFLKSQEFYGRRFRIDFTAPGAGSNRFKPESDQGSGETPL